MTKRKADSADYKGACASSGALAAHVADWEASVAADVGREPQLGVVANQGLHTGDDVFREPQLGVEAGQYRQVNVDVARYPQLGLTAPREPGKRADMYTGPQPITTNIRAEPLGTEEGNAATQATTEEGLGSGPLYTDFWTLLADAGYETW